MVDLAGKGKGVLAGTNFPAGHYVCEYSGELLSRTDAFKREHMYTKVCVSVNVCVRVCVCVCMCFYGRVLNYSHFIVFSGCSTSLWHQRFTLPNNFFLHASLMIATRRMRARKK